MRCTTRIGRRWRSWAGRASSTNSLSSSSQSEETGEDSYRGGKLASSALAGRSLFCGLLRLPVVFALAAVADADRATMVDLGPDESDNGQRQRHRNHSQRLVAAHGGVRVRAERTLARLEDIQGRIEEVLAAGHGEQPDHHRRRKPGKQ